METSLRAYLGFEIEDLFSEPNAHSDLTLNLEHFFERDRLTGLT